MHLFPKKPGEAAVAPAVQGSGIIMMLMLLAIIS